METENIPVPADLEVSFLRSRVPSQRCVVYEVQSSQFTFHRKFQPRSCSQWSFSKWAEWIKLGSGGGFNLVTGSPFSGGIPSPEINAVAKVSCLSSSLIREHESQVVSGTYEFLLPISLKTALFKKIVYWCLRRAHVICNSFLVHSGMLANGESECREQRSVKHLLSRSCYYQSALSQLLLFRKSFKHIMGKVPSYLSLQLQLTPP